MKAYGYIYIHKNKVNGHAYIGQSTQTPERRFRKGAKGLNSYKTCPAFHAALNKYGWEGFETDIVAWAETQEELNLLEEAYIKKYKSADGTHGYNSNWFSEGRGHQSASTKEKIRQKQLAHNQTLKEQGIVKIAPNRKYHEIIDGIMCKHCHDCNKFKPTTEFGSKKDTWDKLITFCKECNRDRMRAYRIKHPPKKLSAEELKQSYENRRSALSEGQKKHIAKKKMGLGSPT